jgi:hypothetical protein
LLIAANNNHLTISNLTFNNYLFQRIGYVGHESQVTGFSHGLSYFALEFQASTRNAARQYTTLLIHKLQKEVRVFVVYVLDTVLLEAAIFLAGILLVDLFVGEAHILIIGQLLPIASVLSADSFRHCGGARCRLQRAYRAP